jgi:hypothetical protein
MNWLSMPRQRYTWWVQLSPCQDVDPGDCTTNHWGFSPCKFNDYSIQGGVSSHNQCLLEMGDMINWAVYIETISGVQCPEDMCIILNHMFIVTADIDLTEGHSKLIWQLQWSWFEGVRWKSQMSIYHYLCWIVKLLSLWKVMCRSIFVPNIPIYWVFLILVV